MYSMLNLLVPAFFHIHGSKRSHGQIIPECYTLEALFSIGIYRTCFSIGIFSYIIFMYTNLIVKLHFRSVYQFSVTALVLFGNNFLITSTALLCLTNVYNMKYLVFDLELAGNVNMSQKKNVSLFIIESSLKY
jgi:hypothetical protein